MYTLSDEYLKTHYDSFVCSYGCTDNSAILSYTGFSPETFFVNQKRENKPLIFFKDISYEDWILSMINDICKDIPVGNYHCSIDELVNSVLANLEVFFTFLHVYDSQRIANQEFVDIIRKIVCFTLCGDVDADIDMAMSFNDLARDMMPGVIKCIRTWDLSLDDLMKYSIISGLSGLDLKGAPAASSIYTNDGIPMRPYLNMAKEDRVCDFIRQLKSAFSNITVGLFDIESFINILKSKRELVWFTDDLIESFFDLLIIEYILTHYTINISIIPKNGYNGNDLCYNDLIRIIHMGLFPVIEDFIENDRFHIIPKGPKMGAANIFKFSSEVIQAINTSDAVFMKGCRIHEMLQGGLKKDTFYAFNVVRQLSEITSGYSSEKRPIMFFHLSPHEYSFFGVDARDVSIYGRDKHNAHAISTIKEHFERKSRLNLISNVEEFNKLHVFLKHYHTNLEPLYFELNLLAEHIIQATKQQYENTCGIYNSLERACSCELERAMFDRLFYQIERTVNDNPTQVSILDVGTGNGRALELLAKKGYKVYGVDNSRGFLKILEEKSKLGIIPNQCFCLADMRSLPFLSSSFDVVRMNASLLHLPLIAEGFSADLAIHEAYRVLRANGLLFVSVKRGDGLVIIDTQEKLGGRVYQLYTHHTLNELLSRNGFTTVAQFEQTEKRQGGSINWIVVIASKN